MCFPELPPCLPERDLVHKWRVRRSPGDSVGMLEGLATGQPGQPGAMLVDEVGDPFRIGTEWSRSAQPIALRMKAPAPEMLSATVAGAGP